MRLAKQATTGFSIMELLVVMAIAAVVAAITLPVTQVLIEQNNVMLCSSNLQRLGVAMKAYYLDWQGVPPVLLPYNEANPTPTPWDDAMRLDAYPEGIPAVLVETDLDGPPPPDGLYGYEERNPLMALYRGGYLRNRRTLHCPRDRVTGDSAHWQYYMSYAGRQPDDTPPEKLVKITDALSDDDIQLNRYKYNPARVPMDVDSSYRRRLSPEFVEYPNRIWVIPYPQEFWPDPEGSPPPREGRRYWISSSRPQWWPDDTTVVTWCDAHADTYQRGGSGIYQVLYWDGSVVAQRRELFEIGGEPDPPAAWEVYPGD